ncbi:MAG: DNA-binding response regulator [Rickettsiales bacterium]|nr:DNA-binding response regulator [Rickettsiales bacterium]OUV53191.1 MAG: hypothetical protein CBC87_04805 [Rickettsiales bacterium TMED127]|tara:strand:- start:2351 stop:3046 length:696 start_codon:yes stop_codon:yes gene_type:complete
MNEKLENQHILCIDDDNKIRELIKKFLVKHNFIVSSSSNALEAGKMLKFYKFDLIILDIMMPKVNGIIFLEKLRKMDNKTPVLMLSAISDIKKKLQTYRLGSDDYLLKPFEPEELIFKIKKLIQPRINLKINNKILFGNFEFDFNLQELKKNNKQIKLTNKELMILDFLGKNINIQISREKIAQNLKISNTSRTVDVFIARLRKKIENKDGSSFLKTIRGKGYVLKSDYEV